MGHLSDQEDLGPHPEAIIEQSECGYAKCTNRNRKPADAAIPKAWHGFNRLVIAWAVLSSQQRRPSAGGWKWCVSLLQSQCVCDAYGESRERFFARLVHDRPTMIAFGERLPFKDGSFDFVIASHVLEHSAEPEKFLSESQRVRKAGYIKVPDALWSD